MIFNLLPTFLKMTNYLWVVLHILCCKDVENFNKFAFNIQYVHSELGFVSWDN